MEPCLYFTLYCCVYYKCRLPDRALFAARGFWRNEANSSGSEEMHGISGDPASGRIQTSFRSPAVVTVLRRLLLSTGKTPPKKSSFLSPQARFRKILPNPAQSRLFPFRCAITRTHTNSHPKNGNIKTTSLRKMRLWQGNVPNGVEIGGAGVARLERAGRDVESSKAWSPSRRNCGRPRSPGPKVRERLTSVAMPS